MAKFTQREIVKIIEILSYEIQRVEEAMKRLKPVLKTAFEDYEKTNPELDDIYSEDRARYQKELDFLASIRDRYEQEVNRNEYELNVKGTNFNNQK